MKNSIIIGNSWGSVFLIDLKAMEDTYNTISSNRIVTLKIVEVENWEKLKEFNSKYDKFKNIPCVIINKTTQKQTSGVTCVSIIKHLGCVAIGYSNGGLQFYSLNNRNCYFSLILNSNGNNNKSATVANYSVVSITYLQLSDDSQYGYFWIGMNPIVTNNVNSSYSVLHLIKLQFQIPTLIQSEEQERETMLYRIQYFYRGTIEHTRKLTTSKYNKSNLILVLPLSDHLYSKEDDILHLDDDIDIYSNNIDVNNNDNDDIIDVDAINKFNVYEGISSCLLCYQGIINNNNNNNDKIISMELFQLQPLVNLSVITSTADSANNLFINIPINGINNQILHDIHIDLHNINVIPFKNSLLINNNNNFDLIEDTLLYSNYITAIGSNISLSFNCTLLYSNSIKSISCLTGNSKAFEFINNNKYQLFNDIPNTISHLQNYRLLSNNIPPDVNSYHLLLTTLSLLGFQSVISRYILEHSNGNNSDKNKYNNNSNNNNNNSLFEQSIYLLSNPSEIKEWCDINIDIIDKYTNEMLFKPILNNNKGLDKRKTINNLQTIQTELHLFKTIINSLYARSIQEQINSNSLLNKIQTIDKIILYNKLVNWSFQNDLFSSIKFHKKHNNVSNNYLLRKDKLKKYQFNDISSNDNTLNSINNHLLFVDYLTNNNTNNDNDNNTNNDSNHLFCLTSYNEMLIHLFNNYQESTNSHKIIYLIYY